MSFCSFMVRSSTSTLWKIHPNIFWERKNYERPMSMCVYLKMLLKAQTSMWHLSQLPFSCLQFRHLIMFERWKDMQNKCAHQRSEFICLSVD
jgi:hypothetical protein